MAYLVGLEIVKSVRLGDKEIHLYKLPGNHYAVATYKNQELEESQFFPEWTDALHKYNKLRKYRRK